MDRHGQPARFFFMHVQKTAGTSLFWALRRLFEPEAIYPNDTDGPTILRVMSIDHLLERWAARRDEIRLVWGHFPYCTIELLDAEFKVFTVLRDPVERTLSFLRYHQREYTPDNDKSFEEIYDNPWVFEGFIHNHQVKMLALDVQEMAMTNGFTSGLTFTPEHLDKAKARLLAMDLVGFREQYPILLAELELRYGWSLGEPMHANATEPVPVSAALRARIAADNAADIELYEFAREQCLQERRR
jgi:hypothetical protein